MAMLPPPRYTTGGQADQMPALGYHAPGSSPVARSAFNAQGLLAGLNQGIQSPLFGFGMGLLSGDTNQAYQNALAGAAIQQRQQALAQQMQMQQAQIRAQQMAAQRERQQMEARQALGGMYPEGSLEAAMIPAGIMPGFPEAPKPYEATAAMQNVMASQGYDPSQPPPVGEQRFQQAMYEHLRTPRIAISQGPQYELATAGEAKELAESAIMSEDLAQLERLYNEGGRYSPEQGLAFREQTTPFLGGILGMFPGARPTEKQAQARAIATKVRNRALRLAAGTAQTPSETANIKEQLPEMTQPPETFMANIRATQAHIERMEALLREERGLKPRQRKKQRGLLEDQPAEPAGTPAQEAMYNDLKRQGFTDDEIYRMMIQFEQ